jgi:glycerol-3-phosphate O-acyltransferase
VALALRDLLKYEFFFPDKETFRHELADELSLIDPDWTRRDADLGATRKLLVQSRFLCAHRVLRSFVDAQWVVAERLAELDPGAAVDEGELLERCRAVGRQLLLQGRLHGPESLSQELFSSALRLARNRGLVDAPSVGGPDAGQSADRGGPGPGGDPGTGGVPGGSGHSADPAADLLARRRAFCAEVRAVVDRVVQIDEIDATNRQETAGVRP